MPQFKTITAYSARKVMSLEEAIRLAKRYFDLDAREYEVVGSITVAPDLYNELATELIPADHEIWMAATALAADRGQKARGGYHAVAIRCTDGRVFHVDTQGYDYARYVLVTADDFSF